MFRLYSFIHNCTYQQAKKILLSQKYDPEEAKRRILNNTFNADNENDIEIDGELDIDLETECYSLNYTPSGRFDENLIKKL